MRLFSRGRNRQTTVKEDRYNLSDGEESYHEENAKKRTNWPKVKAEDGADANKKKTKKKKKHKEEEEEDSVMKEERRQRKAAKKAKRRAEREAREAGAVIESVPTAHSWNSEDSGEDYFDERSRCSRYTAAEDSVPPVIFSDDEDDNTRYSRLRSDGVESLWEEDSADSPKAQFRTFDSKGRDPAPDTDAEDHGPTEDNVEKKKKRSKSKSKKKHKSKKKKHKKKKSSKSRSKSQDETVATTLQASTNGTVLTDPLDKTLAASTASKTVEAGSESSSKPSSTPETAPKEETKATADKQEDASLKDGVIAKESSTVKKETSGQNAEKTTAATDGAKKDDLKKTKQPEENKQVVDVNVDAKKNTKQDPVELDRSVASSHKRIFDKKPGVLYTKSLLSDGTNEDETATGRSTSKKQLLSRASSRDELARGPTPMELDEYSYTEDPAEESALVSCLKFYYCDSAAKLVDFKPKKKGMHVQPSKGPVANLNIDDVVLSQRMEDAAGAPTKGAISPGPKFEVILEEKAPGKGSHSVVERGMSDMESDEELEEAPDLKSIGNCPSMVLEVSGMALRLDDGSMDEEPRGRRDTPRRRKQKKKSKGGEDDLSVTSIEIPAIDHSHDSVDEPLSPATTRLESEDETETKQGEKNRRPKNRKGWFSLRRQKSSEDASASRGEESESHASSSVFSYGKNKPSRSMKKRPARSFFGRMRNNRTGEI